MNYVKIPDSGVRFLFDLALGRTAFTNEVIGERYCKKCDKNYNNFREHTDDCCKLSGLHIEMHNAMAKFIT